MFKPLGHNRRVMKGLFSLLYDLLACHLKEPIKANLHLFVCTQNIHYFPPAELSGKYTLQTDEMMGCILQYIA